MEHEPPPVTVVDPSGTRGAGDVLGDDGPRRGWLLVLGLVVALAAAAGLAYVWDERAADRAAVDDLQLTTTDVPGGQRVRDVVRVSVRNTGPTPVQVLTARLVAPGYATERVDAAVAPDTHLVLELTDGATCGPALPDRPAESVELTVRTARGTTVTRSLALSPVAYREVNGTARQRCGYLPADESFRSEVLSTREDPGSAAVVLRVGNHSLLPVQLTRLLPVPGLALRVEPALPRDLPQLAVPSLPTRWVTLRVTLRVTDCATFLQSYLRNATARGELVRGWLVQQSASVFEVVVLGFDPTAGTVDTELNALATHLLEPCTTT